MVEVLRPGEQGVELDGARRPAATSRGQLLEQRQRALARRERDGVGDLAARDQGPCAPRAPAGDVGIPSRARIGERPVADQVTDVGHDPVLAGLDEPVVVELVDVVLDQIDLLADDAQQGAQRVALPASRMRWTAGSRS